MKRDGFTLTELLVVIAIIGVLAVALGFEFVGWVARYRVESQLKTMHADLMNARQRAMEKNLPYVVQLSANGYVICEDSNGNGTCDAPAETANSTISQVLSKTGLRYPINWNLDLAVVPDDTIIIDRRGVLPCGDPAATCTGTVWLTNRDTGNPFRTEDVDYDCIALSAVQINAGKYNATTFVCDEK